MYPVFQPTVLSYLARWTFHVLLLLLLLLLLLILLYDYVHSFLTVFYLCPSFIILPHPLLAYPNTQSANAVPLDGNEPNNDQSLGTGQQYPFKDMSENGQSNASKARFSLLREVSDKRSSITISPNQ